MPTSLTIFGTRREAIKMAPVVKVHVIFTDPGGIQEKASSLGYIGLATAAVAAPRSFLRLTLTSHYWDRRLIQEPLSA